MVPAGIVDRMIDDLAPLLQPGDAIIDGGNSWYKDDIVRSERLAQQDLHYLDIGTSGGVWGLERGYCLMIGGPDSVVERLSPVFAALAPGQGDIPRTEGRSGEPVQAELGYLHCGPSGAGHFVKMVHNGIEYGIMAAYAEGFNLLRHANIGKQDHRHDAETAPLEQSPRLPVRHRHRRGRGTLAARQRHLLLAAGPDRQRPEQVARTGGILRPGFGFR